MKALVFALTAALVALGAGCIQETKTGVDVLVFEYTLTSHEDDGRTVDLGEHCGTADVDDDVVRIDQGVWDRLGRPGRLIVVDPTLRAPWGSVGDEPFPLALPAAVDPNVGGSPGPEPIASFDWKKDAAGKERAWVDGEPVDLPAAVEYTSKDGAWQVVGTLRKGPSTVKTFGPAMCD